MLLSALSHSGLLQQLQAGHWRLRHAHTLISPTSHGLLAPLQLSAAGGRCTHCSELAPRQPSRSLLSAPCCAEPVSRFNKESSSSGNPTPSSETSGLGPGLNEQGKKTLAHPDYHLIQDMWHPTRNQGTHPADYTHNTNKRVWLRCPGCIHGCGRHHEWEALVRGLTQRGGQIVCPSCESKGGRFCPCRSVAADARLASEWHPSNPPAESVAKSSGKKFIWFCKEGHPDYEITCNKRSTSNRGCPRCYEDRRGNVHHPALSEGRPDLASEWDKERNERAASEVTLGSRFKAWWVCSKNPGHPPWQALVAARALEGGGCPECVKTGKSGPRKFGTG